MLLAGKAAYAGIVFLLVTTWISGPRPTQLPTTTNFSREATGDSHPNDINKVQQTLLDKGHYRGKVDGVFGLRTRASIRAYQKAENLLVTGQLDNQTAGKLGVTPEGRDGAGYETPHGKPSAGIKWTKGSRRSGRTRPNAAKTNAHTESGQ
jgi:peptidoglycan hydrolase-like protein with peptidoglycan-binding domain